MVLQIEQFGDGLIQTFGAFGFLLIFMMIVIIKLYGKTETIQKRNNEISDKAMELMTRVSDKMPSLERIGNLERNHVDILKALDELKKLLDK